MHRVDDELLDLVDEQDRVIGQKWRSEINGLVHDNNQPLPIRSINAFVENDTGQLWIPRRNARKKLWPSALDMSVSGCVSAGESYDQAFAREVQEEINLDVAMISWKFLGYFSPYTHDVRTFMHVYSIAMNEAPDFNPDDYCEYFWMTPQELMDRIKTGRELFKPGLPKLLRIIYGVQ